MAKRKPSIQESGKKTPPKKANTLVKPGGKSAVVKSLRKDSGSTDSGFPIVGIGASAGGLEALEALFENMPVDAGIGFVVVVHLDPKHVSILPELLQRKTKIPVVQIQDGMRVAPNQVYVIPPNHDLTIFQGTLHLLDIVSPRGTNLPIDSFFRALAEDQQQNGMGILLSGTGTDGSLGVRAIKGALGLVMVQDEVTAKYDGMPRSAIATGLVDYVLPPHQMPAQLIKYVQHVKKGSALRGETDDGPNPSALQKIFAVLRARTEHDFSLYKKNTICRRIERRMNVHQIDDIDDYVRYLQESEREAGILFKELLIGVTNFFRDGEAFEILQKTVLPKLFMGKPDDYGIRIWVPGCATGEEAYSIAMMVHECMEKIGRHFHIQIFGTDIDEAAIDFARMGVYSKSLLQDMGSERLSRYFTKEDDGQYRVKKLVREMLVFAPQNIIKDPPFTKLDLLSCRNLLIYFGAELQRKLLPLFHYSLKPDGVLFLGSSETIGLATDLFDPIQKKWKIFRRKQSSGAAHPVMSFPGHSRSAKLQDLALSDTVQRAEELSALQLVETILRESDTPPCAIIDDACNTVYIHGRTGRFLEPAEGRASVNILEMARPGLKKELAAAIRQVATHKQEVIHNGLRVDCGEDNVVINLRVRPILEHISMRGLMIASFEETTDSPQRKKKVVTPTAGKQKGKRAQELEQELLFTRESLQTTIEELETSNEELKSTNEELQSTNEELQSTNEELETSKEELQSLNEESVTVNSELQARIDELSVVNDDMKNLLDSTAIATVFLDTDLRVRRFTPQATDIIPLALIDNGRPISHLASSLIDVDINDYGEKVLDDLLTREAEVESKNGQNYKMKIRPYRTVNNVIDGVVVTFEDITSHVAIQKELGERALRLEESENRIRHLLSSGDEIITVISVDGTYLEYRGPSRFGLNEKNTVGKTVQELFDGLVAGKIMEQIGDVAKNREEKQFETELTWRGERLFFVDYRYPLSGKDGKVFAVGTVSRDVTEMRKVKNELKAKQSELSLVGDLLDDALFEVSPSYDIVFANRACCDVFGCGMDDVIGKRWPEVLHPDSRREAESFAERMFRGEPIEEHMTIVHNDGSSLETLYRARPVLEDGELRGIIGIFKRVAK